MTLLYYFIAWFGYMSKDGGDKKLLLDFKKIINQ